jgi:hypothetical protein
VLISVNAVGLRLQDPETNRQRAAALAARLVQELPPETRASFNNLEAIAEHNARIGFTIADEEQARRWAKPEMTDKTVDTAIAWDLGRIAKEPHETGYPPLSLTPRSALDTSLAESGTAGAFRRR